MRVLFLCFFLISIGLGEERPNILWLSAEDISPHFGCYGDPFAKTPHLDALAERGTRFTHAFTSAGVCAPCRSSIITGMYQNAIGTHHMRCEATLPEWLIPFPMLLREAGYYCTNNSKTDYQFRTPSPKEIWDLSGSKGHWKDRPSDHPFFAVFNFTGCHESGIASEEKYQSVTERLSDEERQDAAAFDNIPPYYPDLPVVREDWKRNYELITALDYWVGDHLAALEEAGVADNTIVFFWSDHGIGLPRAKRWLYDSGTRIPCLLHVPEKFRDRIDRPLEKVDDRIINSPDFGPTFLALAGVDVPEWAHGQSFLHGEPRRFAYGARDRMDERYDIIRSVRGPRFRYIRNFEPLKPYYQYMNTPEKGATMQAIRAAQETDRMTAGVAQFASSRKPAEELYDLENDPHEINNLINDPAASEKLVELRSALMDWQLSVGDIGLIPESEIERFKQSGAPDYDILRQSDNPSEFIKELTEIATAAFGGVEAFEALRGALQHEHAVVRFWGATGLGNFAEEVEQRPEIQKSLQTATADSSPAVKIAAARALGRIGKTEEALPVLEQMLQSENQWARLEAAIVLDELDEIARPALPALQAALIDQPNKYIVRVANRAVNDLLGTENGVP
ncbi:MAG: sulfatase-like hydrolase/transferase [Verrucomicrobiota bacterium]